MSQGAHTRHELVQIGSKYHGPALDRPALRRMPEGWYLTEEKPKRSSVSQHFSEVVEFVVCLACAFLAVGVATMVAVWFTK